MKKATHMKALFDWFAGQLGGEPSTYRFLSADGERIGPMDTPHKLEMDGVELIDALTEQIANNNTRCRDEATFQKSQLVVLKLLRIGALN